MEKQVQAGVTCILTSCGRFDLLEITLASFVTYNSYDIHAFHIYEDSGLPIPQDLKNDYPFVNWVEPGKRTGQIDALDTLWQLVKTPYAFTMEDDWIFLRSGFIEASIPILEANPKILQVWLNPLEPNNDHPIEWKHGYGILKSSGGIWSGTRFNPAVKRKADYDLIAPFSGHTKWNQAKPWKCEAEISKVYHKLGFKGAILPETYIRHIGGGRHVS